MLFKVSPWLLHTRISHSYAHTHRQTMFRYVPLVGSRLVDQRHSRSLSLLVVVQGLFTTKVTLLLSLVNYQRQIDDFLSASQLSRITTSQVPFFLISYRFLLQQFHQIIFPAAIVRCQASIDQLSV